MKTFLMVIPLVFYLSVVFSGPEAPYGKVLCKRGCYEQLSEQCTQKCNFRNLTQKGNDLHCMTNCLDRDNSACLRGCTAPVEKTSLEEWLNQ